MARQDQTDAASKRLLDQYAQYQAVSERIARAESERMQQAATVASECGRPLREVLTDPSITALTELAAGIAASKRELQGISDAMTYESPAVWIRYKYEAYAGTPTAITTMADLRQHCCKPGYICTKRYDFLRDRLALRGIGLDDALRFPDDMRLDKLYMDDAITGLAADTDFADAWDGYEYHRDGGRVAKWENYPKSV